MKIRQKRPSPGPGRDGSAAPDPPLGQTSRPWRFPSCACLKRSRFVWIAVGRVPSTCTIYIVFLSHPSFPYPWHVCLRVPCLERAWRFKAVLDAESDPKICLEGLQAAVPRPIRRRGKGCLAFCFASENTQSSDTRQVRGLITVLDSHR